MIVPRDFTTKSKLTRVLNVAGYQGTANVNLAPDFFTSAAKSVEEALSHRRERAGEEPAAGGDARRLEVSRAGEGADR